MFDSSLFICNTYRGWGGGGEIDKDLAGCRLNQEFRGRRIQAKIMVRILPGALIKSEN